MPKRLEVNGGKNKTATILKTHKKPDSKLPKPSKTKQNQADIDSGVDFCGVKLTAKCRKFIINYITPGQHCFGNAAKAAKAAGYAKNTFRSDIYHILQTPDVQKIIQKNEAQYLREWHDRANQAREAIYVRAFFNPIDFFSKKEITRLDKDGNQYEQTTVEIKDMQNMTSEQLVCIDGITSLGQNGMPVYILPDRKKELNDIIKIDSELAKGLGSTDEEETREIIMERITIRETRRASEYEIVERPVVEEE